MTQAFKLARIKGREIVPDTGESLGEILAAHAADLEQSRRNTDSDPQYWASKVAQLYYLAADAYEHGAAVSIGHNRADRYTGCATRLRKHAEKLEAEGKDARDVAESARMMAAFKDGFDGHPIDRYSFEYREAALLGQLFAQSGEPLPKRINKVYAPRPLGKDSPPDHLQVDDMKFVYVQPELGAGFMKPIA